MATTVTTESWSSLGGSPGISVRHSIPNGETGPAIYASRGMSVTLIPGTSGKLQYTTSLPSAVVADTATWIDWSRGTVTGATTDIPEGAVTAIRGVSVSGTLVLEVAQ